MEDQIQNIPVPPQIGAPVSIVQQLGVPQSTGVRKPAVLCLGEV